MAVFGHYPFIHFFQRKAVALLIHFKKYHFLAAAGTHKRVVSHGVEEQGAPTIEGDPETMFFARHSAVQFFVSIAMPGINTIIPDHFVVLFRYVADQLFNEIHGRDCFNHVFFIFMAVVMESDGIIFPVIRINAGCGNDGTPQVSADVFQDFVWIAFTRFGIHIEPVLVITVTGCFYFFERRADFGLHFVQECSLESKAKKIEVKMLFGTP